MSTTSQISILQHDPALKSYLDCWDEKSRKLVMRDINLKYALQQPADAQLEYFGMRYGLFGGAGAGASRPLSSNNPQDILDLSCFLFLREGKNSKHLQNAVQVLREQGRLKSEGAQDFARIIQQPWFASLVKLWKYSFVIYLVLAMASYAMGLSFTSTINALLTCKASLDFLQQDPKTGIFNSMLYLFMFVGDLFLSMCFTRYTRIISLVPVVLRGFLTAMAVQYGTREDMNVIGTLVRSASGDASPCKTE